MSVLTVTPPTGSLPPLVVAATVQELPDLSRWAKLQDLLDVPMSAGWVNVFRLLPGLVR
jgi:hypothetical protein